MTSLWANTVLQLGQRTWLAISGTAGAGIIVESAALAQPSSVGTSEPHLGHSILAIQAPRSEESWHSAPTNAATVRELLGLVFGSHATLRCTRCLCCLTFELSGPQRQDALARTEKMYCVPQSGPRWPAVAGPLERGVRPRCSPSAPVPCNLTCASLGATAPRSQRLRTPRIGCFAPPKREEGGSGSRTRLPLHLTCNLVWRLAPYRERPRGAG